MTIAQDTIKKNQSLEDRLGAIKARIAVLQKQAARIAELESDAMGVAAAIAAARIKDATKDKDAEIERLRLALKQITEVRFDYDGGKVDQIARTALGKEERTTGQRIIAGLTDVLTTLQRGESLGAHYKITYHNPPRPPGDTTEPRP